MWVGLQRKHAVRICEALIAGEDYDLERDIQEMRELREAERLGPSTGSIVEEAASRGIPWIRLNKYSFANWVWCKPKTNSGHCN